LKRKIKFFKLYDTFSAEERKQFKLFVSSNLYSHGRKYLKILKYIDIDRTVFFEFGNTIKERTLWNRLSELTKLAEKFLVLIAAESESDVYNKILLSELKKRNLTDYFEKNFSDYNSELKKSLANGLKLEEYLSVNNEYLKYLNSLPDSKKFSLRFIETNNYKLAFFILSILDCLIQIKDMKNIRSITSNVPLEEILQKINFGEMLLFIKDKVSDVYPLVAFHYHLYNAGMHPMNQNEYKKAVMIFEKNLKQVPAELKLNLYKKLIDYNIELSNMLDESAKHELFRLIKSKLKEGIFSDLECKNFDNNEFRNYTLAAYSLRKFNWLKKFIDRFGSKLPDEFRDDSIIFGNALIMFHKNEFLKCMEILNKSKKANPYNYIDISFLKLKVLYELNQFDDCYSELRRVVDYMRHNRLVHIDMLKFMKLFCRSYGLLLKLNQNPSKKNLLNLEFQINKSKFIGISWIKGKMLILKKSI